MSKPVALKRTDFSYFDSIVTRWSDNDIYGHVNNVQYYSYFDSAVNRYLIQKADLDIHNGKTIGLVVHSSCDYFMPAAFPEKLTAGVRVKKLGNSSVCYQVAIFNDDDESYTDAIAQGEFVHVYVDKATRKPNTLNEVMREALSKLLV